MASTGYQNGTDIAISVDGTVVAFGTSNDLEITMETRDASNKDSAGWAEKREGQRSWTASGECVFAEDAAYGFTDLFALIAARTKIEIIMSSGVAGDQEQTGQAYVVSLRKSTPNEDTVTYSFSLDGTGALLDTIAT